MILLSFDLGIVDFDFNRSDFDLVIYPRSILGY